VGIERTAALLERAYRMALVLQSCCRREREPVTEHLFERVALSAELVEVLDEARAALLRESASNASYGDSSTPSRGSVPPASSAR
jgi:hypothetical protein